jgi:hypothetical protein
VVSVHKHQEQDLTEREPFLSAQPTIKLKSRIRMVTTVGRTRETREGWALPTVETTTNGDLKSTNEQGPSLVGSLGLSRRYTRDFCPALAAVHYINSFALSPSKLGTGQAVVQYCVACLLICVSEKTRYLQT